MTMETGKRMVPFTYDENGLCEIQDPKALEVIAAGGVEASGLFCKVNSGNCVSGCACKSASEPKVS